MKMFVKLISQASDGMGLNELRDDGPVLEADRLELREHGRFHSALLIMTVQRALSQPSHQAPPFSMERGNSGVREKPSRSKKPGITVAR